MKYFTSEPIKNIYDVIYPFYVISKLCGFAAFPLRVPKSKKQAIKLFIQNCLFAVMIIILQWYVLTLHSSGAEDYFAIATSSSISQFTLGLLTTIGLMNFFISFSMNFILQKYIKKLLEKFCINDQDMEKIGIKVDLRSQRRFIYIFLIISFLQALVVATLTQAVMNYYELSFLYIERITTYVFFTIGYTTLVGHMFLALVAIYVRYKLLNQSFRKRFVIIPSIIENIDKSSEVTIDPEDQVIRKFAIIHDRLNSIIRETNTCFSFQIMMNMISWFIYTIYGTFNFYRLILINFKGYELLGYANMMWIVYHAMYLSAVVIFSSLIKAEGKKTSILLHQAINLEWNSKIVREMRIFSQQLGHRQPIVTCGLFPFDWSLFYSSIGLCVTYLTIMIQLDSSYSNPQLNVTLPAT
uniref:Gustatory receptor n=1 Tax=Lutzomyia longipalpis TaxID=7200 RepID=A0A3F2ZDJ7_LUTLO